MRIAALTAIVVGLASGVADAAPIPCESIREVKLSNGAVLSAELVPAGAFTPPNATNAASAAAFASLPAFCRVTSQLTPSADSDIRVEVWLPLSGWNHKFQAAGNGGLGGTIPYAALANALRAGYAAAGTDTGHVGGNADFVRGHPEKLVDFAHRAIHEMTVTAKTIVTAHYDMRPARSYFNSCSTGGRQALIEAQRYPEDFDGIVAGDPSWDQMRLYAARVWLNTYVNRSPAAVIPPSKYPMIHNAVLDTCDALDGVKDGVLGDPSRCAFDYATLTCTGGDRPDCLTTDQVETAKAMTSPIRDPKSGAVLHPGRYYPGSELGWGGVAGPAPSGESHEGMRKIVFSPDWDYRTIKVPDDVERAVKADQGLLYGGDPDLSRFFKRGGKLLMYHGWADPLVSPDTSLIMFKRITDAVGRLADNSLALFMVPGMAHCQGGKGTDQFDKVMALDQWVESGVKPQSIVASHMTAGVIDRTRPLCAYPATSQYIGTGSTDDAKNFRCADAGQRGLQPVQYRSADGVEYRSLPDTDAVKNARAALEADPKNITRIIDLGIAQSGARQFREAIATFTRGLEIEPNNALLLRWRGHRYLSVREFDRAFADLTRGAAIDGTIYGIWYHLGVIQYLRGDFADAAASFAKALPIAPDAGELAGSTDWLWMSLSRAGRGADAKAMLDRRPDWKPVTNAYTRRLQLYRGEIGADAVVTPADADEVQVATLAYGLGNWYLVRGDTAQARKWFERSIQSGGWPGFGFIVSEVELRRLR